MTFVVGPGTLTMTPLCTGCPSGRPKPVAVYQVEWTQDAGEKLRAHLCESCAAKWRSVIRDGYVIRTLTPTTVEHEGIEFS